MRMLQLPCPSCGAPIPFQSRASVFAVCQSCASSVIRQDLKLENLGKMAELLPDMTPFQIGTQGRFEGKSFQLLGRLQIVWDEGFWNEWYAPLEDGREAWLAEAQGFLMMSFLDPTFKNFPHPESLSPGQEIFISKISFHVDDIKTAICKSSEGELPFKAIHGKKIVSVDLSGPDEKFACMDFSEKEPKLYLGRYIDFEECHFQSLREIDGW